MSQQINLFNPVFLKQKKHFSVLAMLQALALIVFGAAFFYGYAVYQVKLLAKQSEETSKRYAAEQLRFASFSNEFSPQKSNQTLQDELKKFEAELVAQKEILDTLKTGVIGNTGGYSEYMRAFARQTVSGLWLTGFAIEGDGAQMSLQGAVLRPQLVPSYIRRLNKEKIMRGKTFSFLQMQQPKAVSDQAPAKGYVEFSMQSIAPEGAK
ncbi:MAG: fimbrial assembly protein [Gallionellaceae bacterium]|nr:MAG: fimbrial assembly protein [Gallionellaceae bacterium]